MKRIALSIALIAGFALPAAAAENPCHTWTFDHPDGRTEVASRTYEPGAPIGNVEGYFLVVSWTDSATLDREGWVDTLSFDASNLEGAVACADGSVSLIELVSVAEPEVSPQAPAPTPVTLRPVCEVYADSLEYLCTLPNLTLRIS